MERFLFQVFVALTMLVASGAHAILSGGPTTEMVALRKELDRSHVLRTVPYDPFR